MRGLFVVTRETFQLLRRDRIFAPAILVALIITLSANMICFWTIEEFGKVLYDVGLFGFQSFGGLVAIFWGVRSVGQMQQDGALESQLAWPVPRPLWIIGRYLGLALALLLIWIVAVCTWQGVALVNGFRWMRPSETSAFLFVLIGWWVTGAIGTLLGTVCGQALAAFLSLIIWTIGLLTSSVANSLGAQASDTTQKVVKGLARFWDLGQLNLVDHVFQDRLSATELGQRAGYAGTVIILMISISCLAFARLEGER